ncbi:MAG: hypothetical protein KAJ19_22490 [Gammaproteobacteria bacterium]|nr:hypothetical protein [Gammaproteobacteria bacterium]
MAYKKEDLIKQSLEAIKNNNLMYQEDIYAFVGFSKQTYYTHNLDKLDVIKKELNDNRIKTKHSLKAKWYKSDNPTVQIALYKLIGTEDEVHRLSGTKTEQANTHQFIDDIKIKIVNTNNRSESDIRPDEE